MESGAPDVLPRRPRAQESGAGSLEIGQGASWLSWEGPELEAGTEIGEAVSYPSSPGHWGMMGTGWGCGFQLLETLVYFLPWLI